MGALHVTVEQRHLSSYCNATVTLLTCGKPRSFILCEK